MTSSERIVDYSKPMGGSKYTEETVKVPRVGRFGLKIL